jgi:hypothetical protein
MGFILWLTIWLRRIVVLALLVGLVFGGPILYIETQCKGTPQASEYASLLPADAHRDEGRTYTTFPEWYIVHAYDDYAQVIASGDPHQFNYYSAMKGFWTSLCPMAKLAGEHGGFTPDSKRTIYTIGSSFMVEMSLKAAYEETLGRIMTLIRGRDRAPLDDLSATQAAEYADFLRQVPWYQYGFNDDASELWAANTGSPRDWERAIALNIEMRGKAVYAKGIGALVAATGNDELTIRSVVTGLTSEQLALIEGVTVIGARGAGLEIETPRYAAFTDIIQQIAAQNGNFAEIAGNDDILFTILHNFPTMPRSIYSYQRQGYGDNRLLIDVKVRELASTLRDYAAQGITIEHIHDY